MHKIMGIDPLHHPPDFIIPTQKKNPEKELSILDYLREVREMISSMQNSPRSNMKTKLIGIGEYFQDHLVNK